MEEEIFKIFNKVTTTISIISSTLTSIFGIEWGLFIGYLILNLVDYLTGTIKVRIKKVCYWVLIGISFLISYLLMQLGG